MTHCMCLQAWITAIGALTRPQAGGTCASRHDSTATAASLAPSSQLFSAEVEERAPSSRRMGGPQRPSSQLGRGGGASQAPLLDAYLRLR